METLNLLGGVAHGVDFIYFSRDSKTFASKDIDMKNKIIHIMSGNI